MVEAHFATLHRGLVEREKHVHAAARIAPEIVPLVGSLPPGRQADARRVRTIFDDEACRLDRWMILEPGAEHTAVERPGVARICRRMDAEEAAPAADIALEGSLLICVEHVSGRAEEDHRCVPAEVRIVEKRGVLARVRDVPDVARNGRERGDSVRDRIVTKARGLAEDEHTR